MASAGRSELAICGWLALVVLAGLVVEGLTGAWWADAIASLGVVWFLVKEGLEAWEG